MKKCIVVTSEENGGLDGSVCGHFGHSPYFVVVETEDGQVVSVRTVENPLGEEHRPGFVPRFVRDLGAKVVLTGRMGERAQAILEKFEIEAVTGVSGLVRSAVEKYLKGEAVGGNSARGPRGRRGLGCRGRR